MRNFIHPNANENRRIKKIEYEYHKEIQTLVFL